MRLGCEIDVGGRTEISDKGARKRTFSDKAETEKPSKELCEGKRKTRGGVCQHSG